MTLLNGDLTTVARLENWLTGYSQNPPTSLFQQLITSMTQMIYGKINRGAIYSRSYTRVTNGFGTNALVLPDYPVTSVTALQVGAAAVPASPLPNPITGLAAGLQTGFGYRLIPWAGNLPGENAVLEFQNGLFYPGVQNVSVTYIAGYLISKEPQTVPSSPGPYTITVSQPLGVWSRDNGVVYAASGVALVPVGSNPTVGQYIPPPDSNPGLYTFSSLDSGAALLVSYSFIPADLEEACIQMVAERLQYRKQVGVSSQSLAGQETIHYLRGGRRNQMFPDLPPEVDALISPYVNIVPPWIGGNT